jgi:predicted metal-dependent peptidase
VKESLPSESFEIAKQYIRLLASQIEEKIKVSLVDRISGVKDNQKIINRPRYAEIDWHATIRKNLKNYRPEVKTIIPDRLVGHPRRNKSLKKVIILMDQSASMTTSFIYAGILGSIMATVKSIKTHFVVFDTEVVDLTEHLHDATTLLLKGQLGGGTNIQKALGYARGLIERGPETHLILLSDLFEGAAESLLFEQLLGIQKLSVNIICLLALNDQGAPVYNKDIALKLADLDIPCFACSPERFPELMSAALNKEDLERFIG